MQGDGIELRAIKFNPHVRCVHGISKRTKPELRPTDPNNLRKNDILLGSVTCAPTLDC